MVKWIKRLFVILMASASEHKTRRFKNSSHARNEEVISGKSCYSLHSIQKETGLNFQVHRLLVQKVWVEVLLQKSLDFPPIIFGETS
jgi:hypothetical protein